MSNNNTMVSQRKKKILRLHYDFSDIRSYSRDHGGVGSNRMYEILNDRYEAARAAQRQGTARARQLMRRAVQRRRRGALPMGDAWVNYVRSQLGSLREPFTLTLKSGIVAGLSRTFSFNNFYHFQTWVKQIEDADYSGGSDTVLSISENPDAFSQSILTVDLTAGGSPTPSVHRKIRGTYNCFNTFNPPSRNNNCGIVCVAHLLGIQLNPLAVRKEFGLETGMRIEPRDLMLIYNHHNKSSRFLVVIDKDIAARLDLTHFDYIMHDKNHYQVVESVDPVETGKSRKRELMAIDFETRPTEEYVMVGTTKSYLLKDTICSVAYQEYSTTSKNPLIRNTFITGAKSSARQFLDFLEQQHRKGKYYNIVAYNGSRFDYYFLISQLTEAELLHTEISLRGYSIIGMNYLDHTFRDPNCFLIGSLSKLCKSFKVSTPKLTEFELDGRTLTNTNLCFYKPELTFSEFMELEHREPEFWKLYIEYCEFDCISLRELWKSFTSTTKDLIEKMNPKILRACNVNGAKTVGSLARKIIDNLQKHDKYKSYEKYEQFYKTDGKVDMDKYNFVCNFKRGGISHCNQAGKHDHPVAGIDITSQYPTAMIHMKIPSGYSKFYDDRTYHEELHGYYKITNLKFKEGTPLFKPIASVGETGVLEWNNTTINEIYIDSELLRYVIKYYGLVEFNVEKALLSKSYKLGRDIFGRYVNVLFEEKANQDALKEAEDPAYNVALREVIKLFLNSLSGKLVENPAHYKGLVYTNGSQKNLNGVGIKEIENGGINLWVGCGISVYSSSKINLFEYIRQLPNDSNDVIHVETDGIYFDARLLQELKTNVENYDGEYQGIAFGSNLGNIKLEHISQNESYWLGKKFYYLYDHGDVIRVKGVPVSTIDDHGNKVTLVDKSLYEQVYNWKPGDTPIKREFKTLRKSLFGKTMISSHTMARTITPRMTYNVYN